MLKASLSEHAWCQKCIDCVILDGVYLPDRRSFSVLMKFCRQRDARTTHTFALFFSRIGCRGFRRNSKPRIQRVPGTKRHQGSLKVSRDPLVSFCPPTLPNSGRVFFFPLRLQAVRGFERKIRPTPSPFPGRISTCFFPNKQNVSRSKGGLVLLKLLSIGTE